MNNDPLNQPTQPSPTPPSPSPLEPSPSVPPAFGSTDSTTTTPVFSAAPKKKRKGLLIGIIIAVIIVLLGGGTTLAYFWYETPDKVVTDSIVNALKAKTATYTGSINVTGATKVKLELTGSSTRSTADTSAKITFAMDGKDYTFNADARFDSKGDLYVKLRNIDTATQTYRESMPPDVAPLFDKIVAKINDQWIKITADDLTSFSEEVSKAQKCMADTLKKYENDQAAIAEIADAYQKNKFIKIEKNLGTKDGSMGYELKGDKTKSEAFLVEFKNTKLYKSLHDCDTSFTIDEKTDSKEITQEDKTESRVELWVDMWSHQITKVTAMSKDEAGSQVDFLFQPKFNQKVDIATPDKSITLKQLQSDIEELFTTAILGNSGLTPEEAALLQEQSFDGSMGL